MLHNEELWNLYT